MDQLPSECIAEIFSHLDCYDLFRLQPVCQRWKSLLEDEEVIAKVCSKGFRESMEKTPCIQLKRVVALRKGILEQTSSKEGIQTGILWLLQVSKESIWLPVIRQVFSPPYYYSVSVLMAVASSTDAHVLEAGMSHLSQETRKTIVNLTGEWGRTPLHTACYYNNLSITLWLLENGASTETKESIYQQTPLHVAVQRASLPVVNTLLNFNAIPNVLDRDRMSIVTLSRSNTSFIEVSRFCRETFLSS